MLFVEGDLVKQSEHYLRTLQSHQDDDTINTKIHRNPFLFFLLLVCVF